MSTSNDGRVDPVPKNYEGIVNLITREYPNLSAGFQQIARFITQNPNIVALESIDVYWRLRCDPHAVCRDRRIDAPRVHGVDV